MTILDQAGVLAAANVNDWNPRGDTRGYTVTSRRHWSKQLTFG